MTSRDNVQRNVVEASAPRGAMTVRDLAWLRAERPAWEGNGLKEKLGRDHHEVLRTSYGGAAGTKRGAQSKNARHSRHLIGSMPPGLISSAANLTRYGRDRYRDC